MVRTVARPAMMPAAERASLARSFDALGNEKRISLLEELRSPRILAEIELAADEEDRGNVSRQTVTKHLQRLLDAGLVSRREVERGGRDAVEFLLNHQTLYALSEAVRALARLRPAVEPSGETVPSAGADRDGAHGPCLVATRALDEGATYPLRQGAGEWTIGRRRDASMALDFDPSVSGTHCRITWNGAAHVIEDLGSRNGTFVNLRLLATSEKRLLAHGDILGVGRCMFVYWAR